jgi:hypothetical protein
MPVLKTQRKVFWGILNKGWKGLLIREPWSQSYNFGIYIYIQCQRCSRQGVSRSFVFKVEENIFYSETHWATYGVVNFYSAGVVTQDRRNGIGDSYNRFRILQKTFFSRTIWARTRFRTVRRPKAIRNRASGKISGWLKMNSQFFLIRQFCFYKLCFYKLCFYKLCFYKLCFYKLCFYKLCFYKLCFYKLCFYKLCFYKLCMTTIWQDMF